MKPELEITRRDFLNGVALSLAAGTTMSPMELLAASPSAYPPTLTGLRGNHPGSFEVMHSIAMSSVKYARGKVAVDEDYDLVVVGGGISGLAAAWFWRQREPGSRIIVIDNHDDFGGHAKRNEFTVDGRTLIGYGGSQSIDTPSLYSPVARQMLEDIGIHTEKFYEYYDQEFSVRRNAKPGIWFSNNAYGVDRTAPNVLGSYRVEADPSWFDAAVDAYPLADASKAALLRLVRGEVAGPRDLDGQRLAALLRTTSYCSYLRDYCGMTDEVVALVRDIHLGYWGIGYDAVSALEAWRRDMWGTADLEPDAEKDAMWASEEPYIFHFPDGNASISRALVRQLLPDAVPGESMEDLVTSRIDYSRLDQPGSDVRIRLETTVVDVRHTPDGRGVDVTCAGGGRKSKIRSCHVVLACYNQVIPWICPDLLAAQREALRFAEKVPLAYINIAVRNWRAFDELGMHTIYVPQASLMSSFGLDFPVSMGDYRFTGEPDEAAVLHGTFVPTSPGLTDREQFRAGKQRMLEMSFADYESQIVAQLDGALSPGGFDAERDIAAITVNRWPHGYAYEYSELFPCEPAEGGVLPHLLGRQPIGRISIANSDSEATAYADAAIDAAWRAIDEQST